MFIKSIAILGIIALAHSWYPPECCSDQDCKSVPCESIQELPNGNLRYENLEYTRDKVKPSQDKNCHVCVSSYADKDYKLNYNPRCIFIHQNT